MKNLITLVITLIMTITFGQNLTKITTNNDVSFVFKDQNGKLIEHIVLQTNHFNNQAFINIENIENVKHIFNGETLIIMNDSNVGVFSVSKKLNGENVIHGYGISKRYGEFVVNNIKDIETNKLSKDIDSFDLVTLSNLEHTSYDKPEPRECDSGGNGSSQCSVDSEILGVSTGCSVTCNSGYYACCDDGNSTCKCFKNGTGPEPKYLADLKYNSSSNFEISLIDSSNDRLLFSINSSEELFILAFDINGNQMLNTKISSNEVNISSLKSGVYFYVITNKFNEYLKTGKFRK